MGYFLVGANYKTTPIHLREKFALSPDESIRFLNILLQDGGAEEGMVLSTCNRFEVYTVTQHFQEVTHRIKNYFHHIISEDEFDWNKMIYSYHDDQAILHAFRVVSSLDSLVIGENQILAQFRKAHELSLAHNATGNKLNHLASKALYVGKKVRTETEIAKKPVSIGSIALELAERIFENLPQKEVALVGGGKVSELVLNSLKNKGIDHVLWVNRSLDKADKLFLDLKISHQTHSLDQLSLVLQKTDILIFSLSVDQPLLTYDMVLKTMDQRKNRPLILIDLGIPRNVEESVGTLANVYLYNIDHLEGIARQNGKERGEWAKKAETLVSQLALEYMQEMGKGRDTIQALHLKLENLRKKEVEKTLKKLPQLDGEIKMALEKCTQSLVQKILHEPILMLRKEHNHLEHADILRKFFKLDEE